MTAARISQRLKELQTRSVFGTRLVLENREALPKPGRPAEKVAIMHLTQELDLDCNQPLRRTVHLLRSRVNAKNE